MTGLFPKDADGIALEGIARAGSDLSKPMFVNFHVAVPDEASAKGLAAAADKVGYRVSMYASPKCILPWTCECSTRMLATYESVIAVQAELAEISQPFGGRLDAGARSAMPLLANSRCARYASREPTNNPLQQTGAAVRFSDVESLSAAPAAERCRSAAGDVRVAQFPCARGGSELVAAVQ
jgi:hypothetical protein